MSEGTVLALRGATYWQLGLFALLLWPVGALAAGPADRAFTVGNYPVEGTAKNAVAAKEKAIAEGQQAAFRSLLKRLVPVTAYNTLDRVREAKAADFVDGFAIRSEQNSSTQYLASLDFTFQANEVRDLLSRAGVPFVDQQAPVVTLLPVSRAAVAGAGEAEPGYAAPVPEWNEAWRGLDLEYTVSPMKIEMLRAAIPPDALRALAAGEGTAFQPIAAEFKSNLVVVAFAETDAAAKKVVVTLAGQDAAGPIHWTRAYKVPDDDTRYAMELAAVVSLGVLEGRWKAAQTGQAPVSTAAAADIVLSVEFSSRAQWDDIRARLLDMPGVDDVRVGNVAAESAEMIVKYPGGGPSLASAAAARGLSVMSQGPLWIVRTLN